MSVPALPDDVLPVVGEVQLELDESAFGAATLRGLIRAGAEITPVSLTLSTMERELTFARYENLGFYLGLMNRSCQWWIGDWLLYGEGRYGDRFEQALQSTGLAEQTLMNRMSVCRSIPAGERRIGLSFSLHAELTSHSSRDRAYWLDRAEANQWTRAQLRQAMKDAAGDTSDTSAEAERDDDRTVIPALVIEAAERLVSEKQDYGDRWLVSREAIARLEAALGLDPS